MPCIFIKTKEAITIVKNRKCQACGTKFSYCPDCSAVDKSKPAWHSQFCSEECMTIWTTATKYNLNKIDKSEAQAVIKTLKLKDKSEYVECVQRDLENILKEDVVVQEELAAIDLIIQEDQPVEEVVVEEEIAEPSAPLVEEEQLVYYKKQKKNKAKSHEVVTIEEDK